ncbi:MAG: hypothetical protein ACXAD7_11845 [Candidatus Kariarchaeaceae archaeon]|jgi:hypothetical protein
MECRQDKSKHNQTNDSQNIANRSIFGGIFDEAMLLGAKGLILIIIISGFAVTVLSVISKFTGLLDVISQELPDY